MTNNSKKVILLWFEGKNDANALKLVITNMLRETIANFDEQFYVDDIYAIEDERNANSVRYFKEGHGDITYEEWKGSPNEYLWKSVKDALKKKGSKSVTYSANDICHIIHIIDTDCVWLPDSMVYENESLQGQVKTKTLAKQGDFEITKSKIQNINKYYEDRVETSNLDQHKKARSRKRKNVKFCRKISFGQEKVGNVYYNIFFNSINLEHFTSGKLNSNRLEKKNNATSFYHKYAGNNNAEFKKFYKQNLGTIFFKEDYIEATRLITEESATTCSHRHTTIDKIPEVIKKTMPLYKKR